MIPNPSVAADDSGFGNSNCSQAKRVPGHRGMNYPNFMDPTAPKAFNDRNYYTVGEEAHLFWVSIGDNPEHYGRHLWATPFKFEK